jgi:CMP-N,N'-diacetyllegionaminic acid synthase
MLEGRRVLAVVPARSGSKGIPDKNLALLGGVSLIGRAGDCLRALPWIDAAVITTDSSTYAEEGERHGLRAPFLRPPELSSDTAGAVDTMTHALLVCEETDGVTYDVVLIVEPTSPLRRPEDVEACARRLIEASCDSVVTVSPLPTKYHPAKVFKLEDEHIRFYEARGANVVNRQELDGLWWRNGICYALTRECLAEKRRIITERSVALAIDREVVNIDEPAELSLAEFLLQCENHEDDNGRTQ